MMLASSRKTHLNTKEIAVYTAVSIPILLIPSIIKQYDINLITMTTIAMTVTSIAYYSYLLILRMMNHFEEDKAKALEHIKDLMESHDTAPKDPK